MSSFRVVPPVVTCSAFFWGGRGAAKRCWNKRWETVSREPGYSRSYYTKHHMQQHALGDDPVVCETAALPP